MSGVKKLPNTIPSTTHTTSAYNPSGIVTSNAACFQYWTNISEAILSVFTVAYAPEETVEIFG